MKLEEFNYDLPKELIAQEPAEPRDSCRLMMVDKKTGSGSITISVISWTRSAKAMFSSSITRKSFLRVSMARRRIPAARWRCCSSRRRAMIHGKSS